MTQFSLEFGNFVFSKRTEFSTVSIVLARGCFDKVYRMCSIGGNRGMKEDEYHSHLFLCAHLHVGLALSSSRFAEVVMRTKTIECGIHFSQSTFLHV